MNEETEKEAHSEPAAPFQEPEIPPKLNRMPVNRGLLEELHARGLIGPEMKMSGMELLFPTYSWGMWAFRVLLAIGVTLVLTGIVTFFAFNWDAIPPLAKLGGIQFGMLALVAVVFRLGLNHPASGWLFLCASVLIGVFFAVFGQIYQTGADAWQLFQAWALLMLPWVLIARFANLWVLWLAICHVFILLYWDQVVGTTDKWSLILFILLMVFNAVFLVLKEYLQGRGMDWLKVPWTTHLLVAAVLGCALVPSGTLIIEKWNADLSMIWGSVLAGLAFAGCYYYFRYRTPDFIAFALTIFALCILVEIAMIDLLLKVMDYAESLAFLLMGGLTLGLFTLMTLKLKAIAAEMRNRDE